ncbi:MAG TPA: 50S ribosomal protein L25 [Ktedonosporobacter sp.]|jgi:large subunit ribosomal protein L25|nr:50S ribosomal protein L25 [Ktedonosporobacter sp.]
MAQQVELEIAPRKAMGKATRRLRREGIIPANIFGHKEPSQAVQLEALTFERLRRAHGTRSVLALRMDNAAPQTVLIRHIQRSPLTGEILHVDFSRVSMSERVEMKVPLHFVGEAPGVKIEKGVLLHLMEAIAVECRVTDMVEYIEVDVSSLASIDSTLHVSDVKLPRGYNLVSDPEEPIAKIAATRAEVAEEAEAAAETPAEQAPAAGEEAAAE